jgi:DNA-binding transcriptional MerR regulator
MRERATPKSKTNADAGPQIPPLRPGDIPLARMPREGKPAGGSGPPAGGFEVSGVYIISVAARILDMHPQTLRKYERLGLINPDRTGGMLRLYSPEDIRKILLIRHLMDNLGLNLAGVEFALALVDNLHRMRKRLGDAAPTEAMRVVIQQEMSQLFRNLNLPAEE